MALLILQAETLCAEIDVHDSRPITHAEEIIVAALQKDVLVVKAVLGSAQDSRQPLQQPSHAALFRSTGFNRNLVLVSGTGGSVIPDAIENRSVFLS